MLIQEFILPSPHLRTVKLPCDVCCYGVKMRGAEVDASGELYPQLGYTLYLTCGMQYYRVSVISDIRILVI